MRRLALLLSLLATPAVSHELWIEPVDYQVEADTNVVAHLVNGQMFEGSKLPYLPQRYEHFVMVQGEFFQEVQGRIGNLPAIEMANIGDGLHVVAYQSKTSTISYENWQKFQDFVEHKDLGDILPIHEARGLPLEDFSEVYSRFSKSLIGVGGSAGADRRLGLETEIVAVTNPYVDDLSETGMGLQLFYKQDVRADEQIEIYEKAPDGTVLVTLHRTDGDGVAYVPVKAGHTYMADAVVLREPDAVAASDGAVWETLWANMTWAMP